MQHLLATHPDAARLDPITELGRPRHGLGGGGGGRGDGSQEQEQEGWLPCRWGNLPGTLLFEPRFGTSGLFVARVRKGRPAGGGEEEG